MKTTLCKTIHTLMGKNFHVCLYISGYAQLGHSWGRENVAKEFSVVPKESG